MSALPGIICERCNSPAPKRAPGKQKYCEPCSDICNAERKVRWAKANRKPTVPGQYKGANAERRLMLAQIGKEAAPDVRTGMVEAVREVELAWLVRVAMPFSYVASKNAVYSLRKGGHVSMRRDSKAWRDALIAKVKQGIRGREVRENKVWIDIFVQKDNHKGDAINLVDLVCDAVKKAIDVDDRWFSIRRVDWEIVKSEPHVFVGIGQEDVESARACSCCGRILTLACFTKSKGNRLGVGRECNECRRALGRVRKPVQDTARGEG